MYPICRWQQLMIAIWLSESECSISLKEGWNPQRYQVRAFSSFHTEDIAYFDPAVLRKLRDSKLCYGAGS